MKFSNPRLISIVFDQQGWGCAECGEALNPRLKGTWLACPVNRDGRGTIKNCVVLCVIAKNCALSVADNGKADLSSHHFEHRYDGKKKGINHWDSKCGHTE